MSITRDTSLIQQYQMQYESLLRGNEPDWLKQHRLLAFDSFIQQGIPTSTVENWKYTPLRLWQKQSFYQRPDINTIASIQEIQLFSLLDEHSHDVVILDGIYRSELTRIAHLPESVVLCDFAHAVAHYPLIIKQHLAKSFDLGLHPFAALCDALAQQGMVVIIPDDTVLVEPIHLLFANSKNSTQCAVHLRNMIIIGKNAKVEIVEHYADLHDVAYFNNVVTEVTLDENAHLTHYKLEQEGNQSFHFGGVHVKQAQGSVFHTHALTLSGNFSRHDITTRMVSPLAQCIINGLYFTHNAQHVDYHTLIQHEAPHCNSASLYKGILADRSSSVFNGKVVVKAGAQKTQSQQANHNLLLTNNCEANSKPELEIYTDDVKCAHGATTGHLDEDALFFLQARGLAHSKARRMLIRAFANEVLHHMSSDTVRRYCQSYLEMAAYE
ncbi:MAG TPA: Fe-S cluster assembly protein SufD [Gammaproteobacteria bacterium]|nr:Fe-S cluster assembly protein SufD [Gammaproteobacteria bacterium]